MISQLSVPAIVADVVEIRVLEWHGGVGVRYASGDLIVELETHKAIVEVRAGQAGILRQILAEPGTWQKVGLPLGLFSDDAGEALPAEPVPARDFLAEFEIT